MIKTPEVYASVAQHLASSDPCLRNLATIFLSTHFAQPGPS